MEPKPMHTKSSAGQTAGQQPADLVLERIPSGDLAWLRPEPASDEDPRCVVTDAGRRVLAEAACFGQDA